MVYNSGLLSESLLDILKGYFINHLPCVCMIGVGDVVYAVYGRKEGDLIKSPELGHQKCPRKRDIGF